MENSPVLPPSEWFSDRDYWERNRSFIWSGERLGASGKAAEKISSLMGMKPGDRVLDLACGFGRHSLALARMGYAVTGVDLNPDFISEASSRSGELDLDARFICRDMREFIEPEGFSHIILMYNSFGYFEDPGDDARVLSNCFRSLRSGGKLLLQATPREYIQAVRPFGSCSWRHEEEDGTVRLEETQTSHDWTWNTTRWTVISGGEKHEYTYGMRLYDSEELQTMLASLGFTSISLFSGLGGEPYERGKGPLTVMAIKPD